MKKTIKFFVIFAVLLVTVSAYTDRVYEAADGYKAPQISVANSNDTISLADLRGSYVLLNFWTSSDAASRLNALSYNEAAQNQTLGERFCLLSVNLDRSERLFREIVRRDNLSATTHYHATGSEAQAIAAAYNLADGFNSYLIDPEGRIIATNPSARTLDRLIAER